MLGQADPQPYVLRSCRICSLNPCAGLRGAVCSVFPQEHSLPIMGQPLPLRERCLQHFSFVHVPCWS